MVQTEHARRRAGANFSLTTEERRKCYLDAAALLLDPGQEMYEPSDARFDVYAKLLPGRRSSLLLALPSAVADRSASLSVSTSTPC